MCPETSANSQTELTYLRRRIAELEKQLAQVTPSPSVDGVASDDSQNQTDSQVKPDDAPIALLNGLADGVLLLDQHGVIQASNTRLASLLDSTPAALKGHNWYTVCETMPQGEVLINLVRHSFRTAQPQQHRTSFRNGRQHNLILDLRTVPLLNTEGQIKWVIVHIIDSTERLHLEAMLIQNERRAATARLSATVAHEVNTPLQAIQSAIYLASRTSDQQQTRHLERASAQVDRISAIFKRLLNLHHMSDSPPTLIDVNALISYLIDLVRATVEEQHIQLQLVLASDLPRLWGKPDDLYQALLNVLLNAIEAMPDGGLLQVYTSQAGELSSTQDVRAESVVVAISDSGSGIDPAVQSRIFDPFFTTRPDGAGVGLAVSKKIITEHGGRIILRSTPGQGSHFTLVLPLSASAPVDSDSNHSYAYQQS